MKIPEPKIPIYRDVYCVYNYDGFFKVFKGTTQSRDYNEEIGWVYKILSYDKRNIEIREKYILPIKGNEKLKSDVTKITTAMIFEYYNKIDELIKSDKVNKP